MHAQPREAAERGTEEGSDAEMEEARGSADLIWFFSHQWNSSPFLKSQDKLQKLKPVHSCHFRPAHMSRLRPEKTDPVVLKGSPIK